MILFMTIGIFTPLILLVITGIVEGVLLVKRIITKQP